ncbi:MAG: hypothetical protein HXX10_27125 [Rhodoplanes sp.]|uniref:hypothetical protein n=1 Tax=Rhodoplanes sp. TaxID=1968906 RepID=UPI001844C14A|nr:hypothetical protein [Rhodoplanes sp.]NVO17714.1 hypothetical protein [Rhodoplanes sp.]
MTFDTARGPPRSRSRAGTIRTPRWSTDWKPGQSSCLLNTGDVDAEVRITLDFSDRGPPGLWHFEPAVRAD